MKKSILISYDIHSYFLISIFIKITIEETSPTKSDYYTLNTLLIKKSYNNTSINEIITNFATH